MNLIFLLRSVVIGGGIERVITEKANWMAEKGHNVLLLTYEEGNHPFSFDLHPKVHYKDLDCRYFTIYKYSFFQRILKGIMIKSKFRREMRMIIQEFHPDALIFPHNINEYFGILVSLQKKVPIIYECHSTSVEIMNRMKTIKERIKNFSYLSLIKKCDLVITLNQQDAQFWSKYNTVKTIPNPLSCYPDTIPVVEKEKGRILCLARLHTIKRLDRLVDSFAIIANKYPEWHIDIFGDGDEKENLEHKIECANLKGRIVIHHPTNNVSYEYLRSQFLVLSSDSESFSMVLVEAMAHSLPVVSTNCPYGPSQIIDNGITGILTKMDVDDLAHKMEWMITHEKERREMGEKAHTAVAKYKKENVMKEWENAYLSVSSNNNN